METGYCALGHDSPSGQYWYQSLQEIDDVLQSLDDSMMSLAWPDVAAWFWLTRDT